MHNPTPKVSCRYGAPLGRMSAPDLDLSEKLQLQRVRINSGGYDDGGAYWGLGSPLYVVMDRDGDRVYFRASGREDAKRIVRESYGDDARFYR